MNAKSILERDKKERDVIANGFLVHIPTVRLQFELYLHRPLPQHWLADFNGF